MAAEQGAPSDTGSTSSPPADDSASGKGKKRSSSDTVEEDGPQKVIKRRAARACVSCRARKVRCDVVENSPCGNCRWDGVEVRQSRPRSRRGISCRANRLAVHRPGEPPKEVSASSRIRYSKFHLLTFAPQKAAPHREHWAKDPAAGLLCRGSPPPAPGAHYERRRAQAPVWQ